MSEGATIYLVVGRAHDEASWYPVRWRTTFEEAFELVWLLYEQAFELDERTAPIYEAEYHARDRRYRDGRLIPWDARREIEAEWDAARRRSREQSRQLAVDLVDRDWAEHSVHIEPSLKFGYRHRSGHYIDEMYLAGGFGYAIWEIAG